MLENELSTLGFTTLEIKVYLGLFKLGGSTANKISVETKLNRTNVYGALNKLIEKGVVSYVVKNKVKWFEAKSPSSVILFNAPYTFVLFSLVSVLILLAILPPDLTKPRYTFISNSVKPSAESSFSNILLEYPFP